MEYNELESLFLSDPDQAISESEQIICNASHFGSYEEFYSHYAQKSHASTCQKEWRENKIAISCFDCTLNSNACICLECFLNGNHQGHNYIVNPETTGYCDCGNSTLWKSTGFCNNHQGHHNDKPEKDIDEKLRTVLTDLIFKASFSALLKLASLDEEKVDSIFQFIFSFLQLGDGFRRLISISLTEKIDFYSMVTDYREHTAEFTSLFVDLTGFLINDQIFKQNYSKIVFNFILDFIKSQDNTEVYKTLDSSFFYSFSPQTVRFNVLEKKFDWVDFLVRFYDHIKVNFDHLTDKSFDKNYPSVCDDMITNMRTASSIQPNEQTQIFFDRLISEIFNCGTKENSTKNNTIISVSFKDFHEMKNFKPITKFYQLFEKIFCYFKFKKNLKIDKLFEELDKNTDLSPIYLLNSNDNDYYISRFIKKDFNFENCTSYPSYYYSSFYKGSSFFFSMPLYDSFVTIAGLENIFRVKMARLLLTEKYQPLRIKLGIITMKKILAFYCVNQSLTPKKNIEIYQMFLRYTNNPCDATHSIARYIPVFQMLIGLKCNSEKDEFCLKDYFAYEIAREIGIFDEFKDDDKEEKEEEDDDESNDENQLKMTFSYLHLILVTVVDRILFNFDSNKFIREQLICAFKYGFNNLNQLEQLYDKNSLEEDNNPANFNEVLLEISTTKQKSDLNNNDVSFYLKDGIKFNPISGINPISLQSMILYKEIKKNPEILLSIPEFDDEKNYFFNAPLFSKGSLTIDTVKTDDDFETENEVPNHDDLQIRLNELLITPTVLAIVYQSLASAQKNDLNDHLALNVLIQISNFLRRESQDSNDNKTFNDVTIKYNSVDDLISKFRTVVFGYKIDSEKNASIQNSINNIVTFISFLNIKISHNDEDEKSFIDLIVSKGKIGKQALELMQIKHDENSNNEDQEKKIKKQRASRIKEEIMNKYKDMILNYNMNEAANNDSISDAINSTPSNSIDIEKADEVCSVCLTAKGKEILSFPVFIYMTKFPFIFDKQINSDEKDLNFIVQFSMCNHPIHTSCIGPFDPSSYFRCPIDRTIKNGFLPNLEAVSLNSFSDEVKCSIEIFLMKIKQFISNDSIDILKELVKSLSGLIVTYEVRLRSLPGCLDSINTRLLARNLFLTVWSSYRILKMQENEEESGEDKENGDSKLTIFQQFIKKLIECDDINSSSFHLIVESFLPKIVQNNSERSEKELLLFLRRVCLANYFLLRNNDEVVVDSSKETEIIDWDDVLSIENLSKKFKVDFHFLNEFFEFRPFTGPKLPKDFLHFALEPYKFHVEESSRIHLFNLIDYDYLIQNYDDFDDKEMKEKFEVVNQPSNSNHSPSAYLFIGQYASGVTVFCNNLNFNIRPFYLDMFGSHDIGFSRNRPLLLNEERYERFIDEVISGDFTKIPVSL